MWADGSFSWIGPDWEKDLRYHDDTLVTDVTLNNAAMSLELRCSDMVDSDLNVFVRKMDVIDKAIQVHGGLGMSDDTILTYFYRHERGSRIYDGADEVHKVVVARRLLKKYQDGAN